MKTPSRPVTPPTSFASPPRTTPPTARSAGLCRRPSSAMPPRADRTANRPNKRSPQAPKEMGDHPLNMRAGTLADWNNMCQKRSGRPRSTVSSPPESSAPTAATLSRVRTTGRSSGPPNQSTTAARREAPPAIPPTKKYRMMSQVQCGAPLKKVSDIAGSSPALLVHAPFAQAHDGQQSQNGRARHGQAPALGEVRRRQFRVARQAVDLGLVHEEVKGVQPAERALRVRTVQLRVDALGFQLSDALFGARAELGNRPELDRVGGARLRARRLETDLAPVVAQGALLGRACYGLDVGYAETARGAAGATS